MSLFVDPMRIAVAAEFATAEELKEAAGELRERGYERLDAYTPYPVDGLADLLGIRRTRLPWLTLAGGAFGGISGYLLQWWCNGIDYPLDVGGRPLNSAPAFIPVTFEMTVLFASLFLFFGLWIGSRLPEVWNPLFELDGFERASVDRFWLAVDARDPRLEEADEADDLAGILTGAGALQVVHPEQVEPSFTLPRGAS